MNGIKDGMLCLARKAEASAREEKTRGRWKRGGKGDFLPVTSRSAHRTCFLRGRRVRSGWSSEGEKVGQVGRSGVREVTGGKQIAGKGEGSRKVMRICRTGSVARIGPRERSWGKEHGGKWEQER